MLAMLFGVVALDAAPKGPIEVGMDEQKLIEILGPPKSSIGTATKKISHWPDIEVEISGGRVVRVRYKDAKITSTVGDTEAALMILCARQAVQMSGAMNFREYDELVTELERAVSAATGRFSNRPFESAVYAFLRDERIARKIWKKAVSGRFVYHGIIYTSDRQNDSEAFSFLLGIPSDLRGDYVNEIGAPTRFITLTRIDPVIDSVASVSFLRLLAVFRENAPTNQVPDEVERAAAKKKRAL